MKKCSICGSDIHNLLDLGPQPICSRYLKTPKDPEYLHPLVIGQCKGCGVIQLVEPIPPKELKPVYDWIVYNEPEGHLDHLADVILGLPGIKKASSVAGTSYKDESLLNRLSRKGMTIVKAGEKGDVVIARHIVEHMPDPIPFINELKKRILPGGYLVLEAPDFTPSMKKLDYSTIWEEHLFYFTPLTFSKLIDQSGMSLQHYGSTPYMLENAMVVIGAMGGMKAGKNTEQEGGMVEYVKQFSSRKRSLNDTMAEFRKNTGRIAVFGSGHLACAFVNIFGLKKYIDLFVDDNANKQGLFMPGSHLPIFGSSALIDKGIKLALLSVSMESEGKVIKNNGGFTGKGGSFASIFPASSIALKAK